MKIMLGLLLWLTLGFSGVAVVSKIKSGPMNIGPVMVMSMLGPWVIVPIIAASIDSRGCVFNCGAK